jgi:hypothetical protein
MSSQDTPEDIDKEHESAVDGDQNNHENNNELASKLSQELSNWRRRRTTARPRKSEPDSAGSNASQSESARTIRVRGHETLVIRKPKLVAKPSNATDRSDQ